MYFIRHFARHCRQCSGQNQLYGENRQFFYYHPDFHVIEILKQNSIKISIKREKLVTEKHTPHYLTL